MFWIWVAVSRTWSQSRVFQVWSVKLLFGFQKDTHGFLIVSVKRRSSAPMDRKQSLHHLPYNTLPFLHLTMTPPPSPSLLTAAQEQALKALVDAFLPPMDVPDYETLDQQYYAAKIIDPSRFWKFRLSYDPGFWKALQERLFGKQNDSVENKHSSSLDEDKEALCAFLDLLSTAEGTNALAGTTSTKNDESPPRPFVQLDTNSQEELIRRILTSEVRDQTTGVVATTSRDSYRSSSKSLTSKVQRKRILQRFKDAIAYTAYTYHPAMSTTTAVIVSPTTSNKRNAEVDDDGNSKPTPPLYDLNPFWKTMGYPGNAALHLGRVRDAQAVVTARKQKSIHKNNHHQQHTSINLLESLPPRPPADWWTTTSDDATITNEHKVNSDNAKSSNAILECDVVVVGSGAGGSVTAAVLAQAGYQVLVVEQGPRPQAHAFGGEQEASAMQERWETTSGTTLYQARIVGGSTVFHSGACMTLPPFIGRQWAEGSNLWDFQPGGPFELSLRHVLDRLNVQMPHYINGVNQKLRNACIHLGYRWQPIPQNLSPRKDQLSDHQQQQQSYDATSKDSTGFLSFGQDRYGQRTTAGWVFLADAARTGNCYLLDECRAMRVESVKTGISKYPGISFRCATGLTCEMQDDDGDKRTITIKARKGVVAAGGAIQTPLLLQRSGIKSPHLGKHLKLLPKIAIFGFTETDPPLLQDKCVNGFDGPATTILCAEQEHGSIIQAASPHPGWIAAQMPWDSAIQFKDRMRRFRNCVPFLCSLNDFGEGQVTLQRKNKVVIDYELLEEDRERLMGSMLNAVKMQFASGAKEVTTSNLRDTGIATQEAAAVEEYLKNVFQFNDLETNLISTIQVGSCKMSSAPLDGVVDMYGEVWKCQNLFITDGSILPSGTLVDPLITIIACAHMLSTKLANRLRAKDGFDITEDIVENAREIELVRANHRLELNDDMLRKLVVKQVGKILMGLAALLSLVIFWWLDSAAT